MAEEEKIEVKDEEIFVPEEGEGWTAKSLSLRNTVILVRILSEVIARASLRMNKMFTEGDQLTEKGVVEIIALLDPLLLRTVLSIITGQEEDVVEETFTLRKAIRAIVSFWEVEEVAKLLGEVKRLVSDQEFQERHAG